MRLVCPNCDAEYEVPESAIPQDGRDVQCSNCGNTWFFDPNEPASTAEVEAVDVSEPEVAPEPEPEPVPEPNPEPVKPTEPAAGPSAPPVVARAAAEAAIDAPDPTPAAPAPRKPAPKFEPPEDAPPSYPSDDQPQLDKDQQVVPKRPAVPTAADRPKVPRRRIEPQVAEVLREEAAFEAKARARDAGIEVQGDLGLDTPAPPPPPKIEAKDPAFSRSSESSRRDLLPDIEEINSTLRAAGDRDDEAASPEDQQFKTERRRRGFRLGFGLSLGVLGLLASAYVFAPELSEQLASYYPDGQDTLARYVAEVDSLRVWLDEKVQSAAQAISEATKDL